MSILLSLQTPLATIHPRLLHPSIRKRYNGVVARRQTGHGDLVADDDSLLLAASRAAFLRLQESRRPDALVHDVYAECLVPSTPPVMDVEREFASGCCCSYNLATRFIDDKLLGLMNEWDELRQIVLLTDGMDTRPYRISWPRSTQIFDISPDQVYMIASERLRGEGAKVTRGCMLSHIPLHTPDIDKVLVERGYSGSRPSIWVLQGLPIYTLDSLKEILYTVSCLAMKKSVFLGEMPVWFLGPNLTSKFTIQEQMGKIFMINGFRVELISFEEVAKHFNRNLLSVDNKNALFFAEQLQLSDDQMESWRREFQRLEDEGDEEGFEDW